MREKHSVNKKTKWPIGTWKMPYGPGSQYRDAPQRGKMVPGTGKPKGAAH